MQAHGRIDEAANVVFVDEEAGPIADERAKLRNTVKRDAADVGDFLVGLQHWTSSGYERSAPRASRLRENKRGTRCATFCAAAKPLRSRFVRPVRRSGKCEKCPEELRLLGAG
jgi:hypothetical protein